MKRILIRELLIPVAAVVLPLVWQLFNAIPEGKAIGTVLARVQPIIHFQDLDYWQDVITCYVVVQCARAMLWAISAPRRV